MDRHVPPVQLFIGCGKVRIWNIDTLPEYDCDKSHAIGGYGWYNAIVITGKTSCNFLFYVNRKHYISAIWGFSRNPRSHLPLQVTMTIYKLT